MATISTARTIPDFWKLLRGEGWVHVTGLVTTDSEGVSKHRIFPVSCGERVLQIGTGAKNGWAVLYCNDHSVWLRRWLKQDKPTFVPIELRKSCHNMFVPCSDGETIPLFSFAARVADPFWNGGEDEHNPWVKFPATLEELRSHPDFIEDAQKLKQDLDAHAWC